MPLALHPQATHLRTSIPFVIRPLISPSSHSRASRKPPPAHRLLHPAPKPLLSQHPGPATTYHAHRMRPESHPCRLALLPSPTLASVTCTRTPIAQGGAAVAPPAPSSARRRSHVGCEARVLPAPPAPRTAPGPRPLSAEEESTQLRLLPSLPGPIASPDSLRTLHSPLSQTLTQLPAKGNVGHPLAEQEYLGRTP